MQSIVGILFNNHAHDEKTEQLRVKSEALLRRVDRFGFDLLVSVYELPYHCTLLNKSYVLSFSEINPREGAVRPVND